MEESDKLLAIQKAAKEGAKADVQNSYQGVLPDGGLEHIHITFPFASPAFPMNMRAFNLPVRRADETSKLIKSSGGEGAGEGDKYFTFQIKTFLINTS
jgi:hypothetical protein